MVPCTTVRCSFFFFLFFHSSIFFGSSSVSLISSLLFLLLLFLLPFHFIFHPFTSIYFLNILASQCFFALTSLASPPLSSLLPCILSPLAFNSCTHISFTFYMPLFLFPCLHISTTPTFLPIFYPFSLCLEVIYNLNPNSLVRTNSSAAVRLPFLFIPLTCFPSSYSLHLISSPQAPSD